MVKDNRELIAINTLEVHSNDILMSLIEHYQTNGYYVKVEPKVITHESGYKDIKSTLTVFEFLDIKSTKKEKE